MPKMPSCLVYEQLPTSILLTYRAVLLVLVGFSFSKDVFMRTTAN